MRHVDGRFLGPVVICEDTSFHGMIDGDLRVDPGVRALVHGMIAGDLDIGRGADVELRGMVEGSSINRGRLRVYGVVRGFMRDEEGGETILINRGAELRRSSERDRPRRRRAARRI